MDIRNSILRFMGILLLASPLLLSGCSGGEDTHRLAVLELKSGNWKYISTRDPLDFAWKVDSRGLAVLESNEGTTTLVLRDTGGQSTWEAADLDTGSQDVGGCGSAVAVSPDGGTIAILLDGMSQTTLISRIRLLDVEDGRETDRSPEWTTDMSQGGAYPCGGDLGWTGSRELAVVTHRGPGVNDLFWVDPLNHWAERGETTPETEGQLAAHPGTGLVAVVASSRDSGLVLSVIGRDGSERDVVNAGSIPGFDLSPDGSKLAVAADTRLLIIDVITGSTIDAGELQTQGLSWGANDRIAFAWGAEVQSVRPDGSDRQVHVALSGGRTARSPLWSPDATHLAFVVEPRYRD